MATYSLRRFTRPEVLRTIERGLLLRFLAPYTSFLGQRGVALPDLDDRSEEIDYEALATVFMTPDADTPRELADGLFFVDEMATEEGMDILLDETGLTFDATPDPAPADVALQVWLKDPNTLERKHAEQFLTRSRSFECFQSKDEPRSLEKPPSQKVLNRLQDALDDWFEEKRRGRGARVFSYPRSGEYWFLVRHGDPFRREGSLEGGEPVTVFYRPVKYDVVVYDPVLGDLRMNARSKGEKELYRRMFGLHLFSDEELFPGKEKYNLEPLLTDGAASLVCQDVPGLERVVLREVHFYWGGSEREVEIRKADDIFAAYEARGHTLPRRHIVQAKFEISFEGSTKPRMVTIKPPNVANYTRESDSEIVEEWLSRRGFSRSRHRADAAA